MANLGLKTLVGSLKYQHFVNQHEISLHVCLTLLPLAFQNLSKRGKISQSLRARCGKQNIWPNLHIKLRLVKESEYLTATYCLPYYNFIFGLDW